VSIPIMPAVVVPAVPMVVVVVGPALEEVVVDVETMDAVLADAVVTVEL